MIKHDLIVIGASAGGVSALGELVKNLPATLNASLFIVLHIHPQSPSFLPDILQKRTRLIVTKPRDGQAIRRRHVYIAPPNYHMTVDKGRIYLSSGPRINHNRPAIDPLFRSAAIHYGARVIGVILTGTLDDGTDGLEMIKNCGGFTIVQHPEDAAYPDMPRNALEAGVVDHCLKLVEIAPLITRLVNTPAKTKAKSTRRPTQIETHSSIEEATSTKELNKVGRVSAFTCPECHGTLWEIDKSQALRYRCRIGHAFGSQSLLAAHDETMENVLWAAVRTLEENAELSERIAKRAAQHHSKTTKLFQDKAKAAKQNAQKLREILMKTSVTKGTKS